MYLFIYLDYLAFFGFPTSSISKEEINSFMFTINENIDSGDKEAIEALLPSNSPSHLVDVIKVIKSVPRPFEPLIKFHENCKKYLLGIKICNRIELRIDQIDMIQAYRREHNGKFPKPSCAQYLCDSSRYMVNPYPYDFEVEEHDNISLYSLINSLKTQYYTKRRSHPSIKRVISDGETYTNVNINYNKTRKSTASSRSSTRSFILNSKIISVNPKHSLTVDPLRINM